QNLSPDQWYGGLLRQLGLKLDGSDEMEDELDDFWFNQDHLGPLQRWLTALREIVLPRLVEGCWLRVERPDNADPQPSTNNPQPPHLVILIDEIDAVRSLPFSAD